MKTYRAQMCRLGDPSIEPQDITVDVDVDEEVHPGLQAEAWAYAQAFNRNPGYGVYSFGLLSEILEYESKLNQ